MATRDRAFRARRAVPTAARRKPADADGWQGDVLGLQQSAGNHAVTQLLLQRAPTGNAHPVVRIGSSGPSVKELQEALNATGAAEPPLAADGAFGPATLGAVRSYQRAVGLTADGVVGAKTWAAVGGGAPVGLQGASNPQVAAVSAKLAQIKTLVSAAYPKAKQLEKGAAAEAGVDALPEAPIAREAPSAPHDLWDDAADWAGQTAGAVVDTVTETAESASDWVGEKAEAAGDWAGEKAEAAGQWVGEKAEAAGQWVGEKAEAAGEALGDAAEAVGDAVGAAGDWANETAGEVVSGLADAAGEVGETLESWGDQIVQGFEDELQKLKEIAAALASGLGLDRILESLEELYGDLKKKVNGLLGNEGADEEGQGDDIHGVLPGVHYGGLATACDSTDGHIGSHAETKRGPVKFGKSEAGKGDFGLNQPFIDIKGTYTIYRGHDGVGMHASVKLDNTWNVQSDGKTSIKDANDPAIGPSTWDKIANDLDPALGEGYPGSPPRNHYWVESITVAHEKYHEGEILTTFREAVASEDALRMIDKRFVEVSDLWRFQRWLGLDPGEEEKVRKKLNGFLDDICKFIVDALEKKTTGFRAEARAYTAGRGEYEKLVADIRERGKKNGWPKNV